MSFILDPPLLFLLGILLAILQSKRIISPQSARITGFLLVIIFLVFSPLLYLDILEWPLNFNLKPIDGSIWMFHTDYTGIYKNASPPGGYIVDFILSGSFVVFMFALYPLWLFLGFTLTRKIFFKKKYIILKGMNSIEDVKSGKRPPTPVLYSVQRNKDKFTALEEGLKAMGGLAQYVKKGDKVVIKANICGGNPFVRGSYADPDLVGKLTQQIYVITESQVTVVDSDMVWTDFQPVAKAQGWYQAAKKYQFKLVNLAESELISFDFGPKSKTGIQLASKIMIDADFLISVPAMKTHLLTSATLGMKNFYGTHPEGDKAKYHKIGIEEVIVDIIRAFKPNLTIIDGSIGGQSIGPLSVKPVNAETLVFSNDVVMADSIAVQIMGYKPEEIVHLWKAHEEGLGKADIEFDFSYLSYPLPSDGKWERPDPDVSEFYNDLMEAVIEIPTVSTFFNYASDFILYDMATIPILNKITPITLAVLSDAVAGILHLTGKAKIKEADKLSLGHKVAEQIFPEIGQEAWPTVQLQNTLETIGLLNENIISYPEESEKKFNEISDNEEKSSFATTFMPRVSSVGFELRSEAKSKAYSGIQYHLAESQDQSQRVLQNVLIWTRQKVLFSQFYNLLLPLLLGFLGMLIVSSVKDSSLRYGFVSVIIVSLTLIVLGGPLLLHFLLEYFQKREIVYRTPIILPIYGLIFLITIYDIYDKLFSSITLLTTIPFGSNNVEFVLPVVSMIFFSFTLITYLLMRLFGKKTILASHYMDYAPIWVYLKKKSDIEPFDPKIPMNWEIEKIYYDAYHYEVEMETRVGLQRERAMRTTEISEHVLLEIDNNWHAFALSRSTSNLLAWIGGIISLVSFISLVIAPFYYWGTDILLLILSSLFIIMTVSLWLFLARFRSTLLLVGKNESKESLSKPEKQFSPGKFNILWNLREDHARMKIRDKVVDPFNENLDWSRFDDPKEKIVFTRQEFEFSKNKALNIIIMLFWSLGTIGAFLYGNYYDNLTNSIVLAGFGTIIIFSLIFALVINFEPFFVLSFTIFSALLAFIEESIMVNAGLWTYADNTVLFPLFGWPVIMFFIYSLAVFSDLLIGSSLKKYPQMALKFVILIVLIVALIITLVYQPDYFSLIRNNTSTIVLMVILLLGGALYLLIAPLRETITLALFTGLIAGMMEIFGNLSGMWTFDIFPIPTGFSLDYFQTEFPLFVITYWIFRIAVVLLLAKFVMRYIVKKKSLQFDKFF